MGGLWDFLSGDGDLNLGIDASLSSRQNAAVEADDPKADVDLAAHFGAEDDLELDASAQARLKQLLADLK